MNDCFTLDSLSPNSHSELGDYLYIKLKDIKSQNRPIIFLCIGTDRATGDSLGPLIGYKLKDLSQKNIYIYGSLEYPIHSVNLVEILNKIKCNFKNPFIIGIDASLGDVQQIGKIFIEDLPLHPGLALNKNLPEVGEMNIKGVVNISGSLDFMMLQNTRLFVVMSYIFAAAGIAQKYNCALTRLDYQQEAGLMSSIPLGENLIPIQRGLTTSSTAIFIPFITQELFQTGAALYYGLNALSNNMILCDRKQLKNPNGLILGTPGSGKSFAAKREITNAFLITDDDIFICDQIGRAHV